MNVVLVRHGSCGKAYWFEVPDQIVPQLLPGTRVTCDTVRGKKSGVTVGSVVSSNDVMEIMQVSGATFPLRKILNAVHDIKLADITIPNYMAQHRPRDALISKRFLEYYHTMQFQTKVTVDENGVLKDGYSAYLVAKLLGLSTISVMTKRKEGISESAKETEV